MITAVIKYVFSFELGDHISQIIITKSPQLK